MISRLLDRLGEYIERAGFEVRLLALRFGDVEDEHHRDAAPAEKREAADAHVRPLSSAELQKVLDAYARDFRDAMRGRGGEPRADVLIRIGEHGTSCGCPVCLAARYDN